MRRFLTISFIILALAVSAAGSAPAAHAEDTPAPTEGEVYGPRQPTAEETAKAMEDAAKKQAEETRTQSARWGLNYVMTAIAALFAWLVGVAALMLNFSMYYTVVNMGGYVTNLPAIKAVWEILRDIGNILLIFGFLAIGISVIIDSDWYGGGQKLLPKLLIVAVFANFSLFAAEAMIDVGNLFATQIYKQINEGEIAAPKGATDSFKDVVLNKGVSGILMKRLALASIYGEVIGQTADGKKLVTDTGPWYMGFMSIIVLIVVAFVLFALAFILISRFVILILLIMVSPIGVAGLAVPGLQGWANKWWETLFHQTITAPILLLMLYIALRVIVNDNFLGFGTTAPAWGGTETGYVMEFAGTLLSYLIAIGLLLAVVYFAKTLSAVGTGWATRWAGRLSFGAAAFGMSVPINSVARLARYGVQRSGRDNAFTRGVSRSARFLENSRADIRSLPGVGAGLTAANAGEAAKPIERGYLGRGRQVGEWWNKSGQESDRQYDQETRLPRLRRANAAGDTATAGRILGNMSDKELEERSMQQVLAHPIAAAALAQGRFDKLMTSDVLNDAQKATLRGQRGAGIRARYANAPHPNPRFGGRTIADVTLNGAPAAGPLPRIPGLSSTQRAELDGDILALPHVMTTLTARDFNAIARRAQIEGPDLTAMSAYLNAVAHPVPPAPVTPLGGQIAALAATNRGFAAFFGLP